MSSDNLNSNKASFVIHLINVRSICNKLDILHVYIDHHKPDILAITETWGRDALTDNLITPNGYTLFRKDRIDRLGGGVLLLVRDELSPHNFFIPEHIERYEDSVWCVVQVPSSQRLLVGCIYRSPSSNAENDNKLCTLFNFATDAGHDYRILLGDFNSPNIDWKLMSASSSSGQILVDNVLNNCLSQMVHIPTRGDNILDLAFVNDPSFVSSVQVENEFPGSDHKVVTVALSFAAPSRSNLQTNDTFFRFSRADWPLYRLLLEQNDWDKVFRADNVDVAWSTLKDYILTAANAAIPRASKNKKIGGVPLSGSVRRAFRSRKKTFHSLSGSTTALACELREQADGNLRQAINESRKRFESIIAAQCKSNPKQFWGHIRSAYASKPKITAVIDSDGQMTRTDEDTAQVFNNFFISVFNKDDAENLNPKSVTTRTIHNLNSFNITLESIQNVFMSLPPFSSPGPDGIQNVLLKEGGTCLLLAVKNFFSHIISDGLLPMEWKKATVVPIFKKGTRSDCKNYRPISLTCTLCKVFERLLKDVMLDFLLKNDLLNHSQHGFVPNRSCGSALLTFLEKVTSNVDNRKSVDVIYLDFSKAFDSVPHNYLIYKLRSFGFDGIVIKLIKSFLSDRQQKVTIGKFSSTYLPVTSGVPQGSVLGPLLFVIYIDDIDTSIGSSIIKFADDVKLFMSFDTNSPSFDSFALQNDLDRVANWCAAWLLKLNITKCSCLHIGHKNPLTNYKINDFIIAETDSVADLGVTFTNDLKPSKHCLKAAAKAQKMLAIIKLAFKFLDVHTLSILYKSLIRPILEYCSVVWCPYYVKDIEVLEKVQRRFTRVLPATRHLTYDKRLCLFNLESLYTRRLKCDLTTVFKVIHGIINIEPTLFFNFCSGSGTRGHKYKISTSYARLDARRYFFSTRVVPLWNALPAPCAEAPNINTFKSELSKHFLAIGFR